MIDEFGREYIAISFGLERHFPGFVDAYLGPDEIRASALAADLVPVRELLRRIQTLREILRDQPYPPSRNSYLEKQLGGMEMVARKLTGESIPYVQEVQGCFDIVPEFVPESVFEEALRELDAILPGPGSLNDRMIAWRDQFIIDLDTARIGIDLILDEARSRTARMVDLPAGESIELAMVVDQPWSGYNWYLGNAHSRVDFNTDLPLRAIRLVDLVCHECYPGHHTEHSIKDRVLFQEMGYAEHAIHLINTPECVISEGIATVAEAQIFPGDEAIAWKSTVLYPALGIAGDPEREANIARTSAALRAVPGNAALMRHSDGASEREVVDYIQRFDLVTEAEAERRFRFIDDPLWRPYIFTYHAGRDLMLAWLDGTTPSERWDRFRMALMEQITPSWIQERISTRQIDAAALG